MQRLVPLASTRRPREVLLWLMASSTLDFSYKHPLYKHPRLKNREKLSIYVVNDVIVTEARLKSDMLIKRI